ncbi:MAG: ester cyclase [Chloroflexi bacterium]|nr:ester cyclase [Chloroflexota bacterium]
MTDTEANKALVRRFFDEVMNEGKVDLVDEIFAPEYVNRHAHPGQQPGPDGVRQLVTNVRRAFPDLVETVDDLVAEGDRVGLRLTLRGTHLGAFRGAEATGRRVEVMGMAIVRIADDRIAEGWFFFDREAMWEQLGIDPPAR